MTRVRWQPFDFESVPAICPRCGCMDHADAAACRFPATGRAAGGPTSGAEDPGGGTDRTPPATEEEDQGPVHGPWMVATRRRVPRENPPPRPGETTRPDKGPGLSSTRSPPPAASPTSPASPADTDGWQKPTKVARRRSPLASEGDRPVPAALTGAVWFPLAGNPGPDSVEPGPSRRVDPAVSVDPAPPRADHGPNGAVAARAQNQKRPRPLAGLGPHGGPGLLVQNTGQAQRARAQRAGRRGRGPAHLIGAPCANGAPRPDGAPGAGGALPPAGAPCTGSRLLTRARPAPGLRLPSGAPPGEWAAPPLEQQGPRAQLAVGPQASLVSGLGAGTEAPATQDLAGGGPRDSAQPALGAGDLADLSPLARDELTTDGGPVALAGAFPVHPTRPGAGGGSGVLAGRRPGPPHGGRAERAATVGCVRGPWGWPGWSLPFWPTPPVAGVREDATPGGRVVGDHPIPHTEGSMAEAPPLGGGTDHSFVVQRVRAAVMGVVSAASGEDEGRDCRGAGPEDGPATLGEDESEADYVDCDP
ncbi:collagen alpha-1(I) chain-like [Phoenix dactylifera]|uniref:Collagen alpha-1(I) chain-like n=1 Tax=Phoenix dactylifera TaxID=42345 RepID=A0A8B9AB08_PHODC|nr:collagen alpha-1(I) chain-like [Phoenix dactylifera]